MVTMATAEDSETSVNVAEGDGVEEEGEGEGEGREEDGEGDYEQDIHEEDLGNQQPMELGSPLDSGPEFDLTGDLLVPSGQDLEGEEGEGGGEEGGGEGERGGEEEEQVDREEEKAEEDAEQANAGKRMDRLDSNFDSSYQPGSEELLYEGDPDNEVEMKNDQETGEQAAEDTSQAAGEKAVAAGGKGKGVPEKREEDEEFMLEVHYKDQGGGGGEGLEEPAPGASSRDAAEQAKSEGTRAAESARFVSSPVPPSPLSPQGLNTVPSPCWWVESHCHGNSCLLAWHNCMYMGLPHVHVCAYIHTLLPWRLK